MTDEEMAEEYANKTETKDWEGFDITREVRKQAFLAGLKAGRPQWHDLNDKEPSKEQLGKQLLIRMKSVIGTTEYEYFVYKYTGESIADVPGVIAWKEIEKC